ncbi:MAG: amidohydrolase [Oscillospiraceae bacterium]|nr:amidohydrolase [Oscillospiraceae bacterium]
MNILIKDTNLLQSDGNALYNTSVFIEDTIIKSIGAIPADFIADKTIDGSGYITMPGLVNAHTHSPMTLLRNIGDDLPFREWLFDSIIPLEGRLSSEDIYYGSLLGILEMIRSGVTCFCDMYFHTDSIAAAISESGIRAHISYGLINAAVRGTAESVDVEGYETFLERWHNKGNITTGIEVHSVYLYEKQTIVQAADIAKSLDSRIHIHLAETASEVTDCYKKYSMSPVELAASAGVFDCPTIAAHCTILSDKDIQLLKQYEVNVVHCPSSNLKLACGVAPVTKMLDAGINVTLGTDSAASNNNLNMFEEMHLAALLHKCTQKDPTLLDAATIVEMATSNGAKAAGFNNTGELIEGKLADVIMIDMSKPHMNPPGNLASSLIYSAQASDVDTVIVGGTILMEKGQISFIDQQEVIAKVKEIRNRILF